MSALRSQPLYLNSMGQQIFTLHYPAEQSAQETIIICPPAPQEIMRSQGSLGQLAKRLQDDGRQVFRFDYSCTGDSEGDSELASLDQWLEDVLEVCAYAHQQAPGTTLSLLGLRLGATLALRASQKIRVHRLVLWDPILDGIHYLHELERSHGKMFQLNPIEPPFPSWRYGKAQCCGFPWSDAWRSQIAAISPALLKPGAQKIHVIQSAVDPIVRDGIQAWQKQGLFIDLQHVGEPMHWGDERYIKIRAFPSAHLRRIQALWGTKE